MSGHKGKKKLPDPIRHNVKKVEQMKALGIIQPDTEAYLMGRCSILLSPPIEDGWGWHMSIAHPKRYPTWDEIAKARYDLLPDDRVFVMVLPAVRDYVNVHENCFHLWEDGKKRSNQ